MYWECPNGECGELKTQLLPPEKNFSGRYCFALCLFFFVFCFMFAGALSLERLDGSQPNFHTRWRGGLARTLLKMSFNRFNCLAAILEKLFLHNCDCSCCTVVAFILAQALTKCHPLHSVHGFQLPYNNLMPALGGLILASSSYDITFINEMNKQLFGACR